MAERDFPTLRPQTTGDGTEGNIAKIARAASGGDITYATAGNTYTSGAPYEYALVLGAGQIDLSGGDFAGDSEARTNIPTVLGSVIPLGGATSVTVDSGELWIVSR